jgi:hypothetical protein
MPERAARTRLVAAQTHRYSHGHDAPRLWRVADLHYRSFDGAHAWLCWETGRTWVSDHPLFKPVGEFEARLAKDFPEFF